MALCSINQSIDLPSPVHAAAQDNLVPIVELAFKNGMWWSLPLDVSQRLLDMDRAGQDASYVWDWGRDGRKGSYRPHGEESQYSRYMINFETMVQTNIDNGRKRSLRVVWVRPQGAEAIYTGSPDWHW